MAIHAANGPVSWGVDMPDTPNAPPWESVFDEIAEAGYRWCELGPAGYLPDDDAVVEAALRDRGLSVAGSFVFEPLHDRSRHDNLERAARTTCRRIARLGGKYLVVINGLTDERAATAGRRDLAPEHDADALDDIARGLRLTAAIAHQHGLTPVLHAHAGTAIEYEDELVALLDATADDGVHVCLDTGHLAYSGTDPVQFLADHRDRVRYLHFKDIDPEVHARVVEQRIPFLDAVALGVFCPIGDGIVDFGALARELDGWFDGPGTVEQDRSVDADTTALDDARASLATLRRLGLAD